MQDDEYRNLYTILSFSLSLDKMEGLYPLLQTKHRKQLQQDHLSHQTCIYIYYNPWVIEENWQKPTH